MPWKEPAERHNEAMVEAIHHAAHHIATAITQGFKHMANQEAKALADLTDAVTAIGEAVATEISALQRAINDQGANNSPAIEASVTRLRQLASDLKTSAATEVPPGDVPVIVSISPTSGPTGGGTSVSVTGTGLSGVTEVTVGGQAATSVMVASDTALSFITPASFAGPAAVIVTGPAGVSAGATSFTYA